MTFQMLSSGELLVPDQRNRVNCGRLGLVWLQFSTSTLIRTARTDAEHVQTGPFDIYAMNWIRVRSGSQSFWDDTAVISDKKNPEANANCILNSIDRI